MKVRIKTAHGYLSIQPNHTIEFRRDAGPWEEFEVEGLQLEPVAPAPGQPAPAPVGPPASPTQAYVAAIKAQCLAAGMNLSGPCGAFAIVKRVAWGLRAQGYGLLSKPSGNNCEGFSTDVIVAPNRHDIVDLLGDAGGDNVPNWLVRPDEVDPSRFRDPEQP